MELFKEREEADISEDSASMQIIIYPIPLITLASTFLLFIWDYVSIPANIVMWDGSFYDTLFSLLLESIYLLWGDRSWFPEPSPVSASVSPVSEVPSLSLQHGALPAAVGAAVVQHWHVHFSHDAVADSRPQVLYFNNLLFPFIHQDPVLLHTEWRKKEPVKHISLACVSVSKVWWEQRMQNSTWTCTNPTALITDGF